MAGCSHPPLSAQAVGKVATSAHLQSGVVVHKKLPDHHHVVLRLLPAGNIPKRIGTVDGSRSAGHPGRTQL